MKWDRECPISFYLLQIYKNDEGICIDIWEFEWNVFVKSENPALFTLEKGSCGWRAVSIK